MMFDPSTLLEMSNKENLRSPAKQQNGRRRASLVTLDLSNVVVPTGAAVKISDYNGTVDSALVEKARVSENARCNVMFWVVSVCAHGCLCCMKLALLSVTWEV